MSSAELIRHFGSYGLMVSEDRILLCQIAGGPDHGLWTLPGGGVEFGEHPEEAVVREVLEETGFEVRVCFRCIDSVVVESQRGPMHWLRVIYDAEAIGGSLRNEVGGSTSQAKWFSREDVAGLPVVCLAALGIELALGDPPTMSP